MEEIPASLVLNWDQTAVRYVPSSNWTMEKEGSKRVEVIGSDDKRQITALFTVTMAGDFLAPQLIYQGRTKKCHPNVVFPSDWNVTHTDTHWSNEATTLEYISKILLEKKKQELEFPREFPALVIFDKFKGQCTDTVMQVLKDSNTHVVIVPAACTDRLQPLDLSLNKSAKEFLRQKFREWYSKKSFNSSSKMRIRIVLHQSLLT